MQLEPTWYSTTARARSRTKWIVFDDVGMLSVENGELSFRGENVQIEKKRVTAVHLGRQNVSLLPLAVSCLIALLPFVLVAYLMTWILSVPPWIAIGVVGVFYAALVAFGVAIPLKTKWVRVTFSPEQGEPSEAYFADGGQNGWRGIKGGTEQAFADISNATTLDRYV